MAERAGRGPAAGRWSASGEASAPVGPYGERLHRDITQTDFEGAAPSHLGRVLSWPVQPPPRPGGKSASPSGKALERRSAASRPVLPRGSFDGAATTAPATADSDTDPPRVFRPDALVSSTDSTPNPTPSTSTRAPLRVPPPPHREKPHAATPPTSAIPRAATARGAAGGERGAFGGARSASFGNAKPALGPGFGSAGASATPAACAAASRSVPRVPAAAARVPPIARRQSAGVPHSIARPVAAASAAGSGIAALAERHDLRDSAPARAQRSRAGHAEPSGAVVPAAEAPFAAPFRPMEGCDEYGFVLALAPESSVPPSPASDRAAAAQRSSSVGSDGRRCGGWNAPPTADTGGGDAGMPPLLSRMGDSMNDFASAASIAVDGLARDAQGFAKGLEKGFDASIATLQASLGLLSPPSSRPAAPPSPSLEGLFTRLQPPSTPAEWSRLLAAAPASSTAGVPRLPLDSRLRRLVSRGVPAEHRALVWRALLLQAVQASHSTALLAALDDDDYYDRLLARRGRATHADVQRLIKADARRTFGTHRHARPLQSAIRRLLDAYSHRNPGVGYCQAMNFIAATLLLVMAERHAFWCFCVLIELVIPPRFYSPDLHGVTAELRVLSDLLSRSHGALLAHLARAGVTVEMTCSRWLMCLFVTELPFAHTCRLWDLMALDAAARPGCSAVPLMGCLGTLQLQEAPLLAAGSADTLLPRLINLPATLVRRRPPLPRARPRSALARAVAAKPLTRHVAAGARTARAPGPERRALRIICLLDGPAPRTATAAARGAHTRGGGARGRLA